jgi:ribonuclease HI
MSQQFDYLIISNGGSRSNGSADAQASCSYRLSTRDGRQATKRLELPAGTTNNAAEYQALIAGLNDLVGRIQAAGRQASQFTVEVRTDSNLVANQVTGDWGCQAAGLIPLHDKAKALVGQFGQASVVKVTKAEVVAVLGH